MVFKEEHGGVMSVSFSRATRHQNIIVQTKPKPPFLILFTYTYTYASNTLISYSYNKTPQISNDIFMLCMHQNELHHHASSQR